MTFYWEIGNETEEEKKSTATTIIDSNKYHHRLLFLFSSTWFLCRSFFLLSFSTIRFHFHIILSFRGFLSSSRFITTWNINLISSKINTYKNVRIVQLPSMSTRGDLCKLTHIERKQQKKNTEKKSKIVAATGTKKKCCVAKEKAPK